MAHTGILLNINNRKIFLVRGIFDYFDKNNFTRLMQESEQSKNLVQNFI